VILADRVFSVVIRVVQGGCTIDIEGGEAAVADFESACPTLVVGGEHAGIDEEDPVVEAPEDGELFLRCVPHHDMAGTEGVRIRGSSWAPSSSLQRA